MELELADDLRSLLTLERVDRDLFRGRNANYGPRRSLYGGQVAAQCLLAAAATVDRDRLGALGATLYQEHLLLPGSMLDVLGDPTGQVERVGNEELRRAQAQHPAGR